LSAANSVLFLTCDNRTTELLVVFMDKIPKLPTMIDPPTSMDKRPRRASPDKRQRQSSPVRSRSRPRRIQIEPIKSSQTSLASVRSINAGTNKLALAVDPLEVQRSVSREFGNQRSPIKIRPSLSVPLASPYRSAPLQATIPSTNSSVTETLTETISSTWHDERLQKTYIHSNTFQKRLEDQAAEAIRKAEEKQVAEYEKRLKNCIKTIEAVEQRKKNDLRLVELRKKAEMEKIKERIDKEMYDMEKRRLVKEQEELKKAVHELKNTNSELRYNCRKLAAQNKQLMAEIEARQQVDREVLNHSEIVKQMKHINDIFRIAHRDAVEDLKHLEEDCIKEEREKKKIQNWISDLITLMESRCAQPILMDKIHKIERRAKAQRKLVDELRRKRHASSKKGHHRDEKSQISGTTTGLWEKVHEMRKETSEATFLVEEVAIALKKKRKETMAAEAEESQEEGSEGREDQEQRREQGAWDNPINGDDDVVKKAQRASKKMDRRRREIDDIVLEMKTLDVVDIDEPPEEIFI